MSQPFSPTATLESTVSKLRADNYQLKIKLDEKEEAAKSSEKRGQMKKPAAAKNHKTFFEDIKFDDDDDKKKENESPNSKAKPVLSLPLVKVDSPTDCEGGKKEEAREAVAKKKAKTVSISGVAKEDEEGEEKPTRQLPRRRRRGKVNEVVDAAEEAAKMEEQCKQQ